MFFILRYPVIVLERDASLSQNKSLWSHQNKSLDRILFLVFILNSLLWLLMEYRGPGQWVRKHCVLNNHSNVVYHNILAQCYLFFVSHNQRTIFLVQLPQLMYVLTCIHIIPVVILLRLLIFLSIWYQSISCLKSWSQLQIIESLWFFLLYLHQKYSKARLSDLYYSVQRQIHTERIYVSV